MKSIDYMRLQGRREVYFYYNKKSHKGDEKKGDNGIISDKKKYNTIYI